MQDSSRRAELIEEESLTQSTEHVISNVGQDLIIYVQVVIYCKALVIWNKKEAYAPEWKHPYKLRFNMQLLL